MSVSVKYISWENVEIDATSLHSLDERIHYVAAKVVHLGDQLEGANAPRMRVHESRTLLQEYFRFMNEPNYVLDQVSCRKETECH